MTFRSPASFLALAAAIALTGLQAAAFAGEAAAPVGRTVEVRTGDLNLANPEGQARLDQRIGVAVRRVCQMSDTRSLRAQAAIRTCEEAAHASARLQRDSVVAAAQSRQGRSASVITVLPGVN